MTTYHDPAPLSRRAARRNERLAAEQHPDAVVQEQGLAFAVQSAPFAHPQQAPGQPTAAPDAPSHLVPDALATPPVDGADGTSFRRRVAPVDESVLPATRAMSLEDRPTSRRRDFSPEGRRAAGAATDASAAPHPPLSAPAAPTPWQPSAGAPVPVEHTMSRRELRALREQQASASATEWQHVAPSRDGVAAEVPPALETPLPPRAPEPAPSTGLTQAIAEFDALARARPLAESSAALPFSLGPTPTSALEHEATAAPAALAPEPVSAPEAVAPPVLAPESVPAPQSGAPQPVAPQPTFAPQPVASPDPSASAPATRRTVEAAPASTWTVPENHWSRQLEADHDDAVSETTVNRTVGATSPITNALMLPAIPHGDIRGALTDTGEVMLTGSIDLPRTLATTGSTMQLEHSGIDALFEHADHEAVDTDSAPVRASRAVSSRAEGVLAPTEKPKQSKAFTVLLVTACGLAVVVTGLVVAALGFALF